MATPEGKVKDAVRRIIASVPGTYSHWPVVTHMGRTTLDCTGIRPSDGRAFAVETKAPGERNQMTVRQRQIAADMRAAKGVVFCVDDPTGFDLNLFDTWLRGDYDSKDLYAFIDERILPLLAIPDTVKME